MDLLEYQAKQLFAQVGIPVLPSQSLVSASDLKNLHIPYPIVLKSQVLASERIKYGGIHFVSNTIDAIAAAQSLFNLAIKQEYPQVILAEARYDVENELFLAIIIDYALKKPVLLGSAYGGQNLELLLKNLHQCVIVEEFSPFYARSLVTKMGLTGNKINAVASILEKMYELLISYDLDLVEINPLGINKEGEFMALDGKIRVNNYALKRHQDLLQYLNLEFNSSDQDKSKNNLNQNFILNKQQSSQSFNLDSSGNLVIISDNMDETILINNMCAENNLKINTIYLLPCKNKQYWQNNFYNILLKIIQLKKINSVFINHSNRDNFIDILLTKIITYYQQQNQQLDLDSEDRIERPTGMRFKTIGTKNDQQFPLVEQKMNWFIKSVAIDNQEKDHNLPIHFTDTLETTIELIIDK